MTGVSQIASALVMLSVLVAPALAMAANIVPHRALYRLTLDSATGAQSIEDAGGLIAFQWTETCESVEINEAYSILIYADGGQVNEFGANFVGRERRDGSSFDFRFEQTGAGETLFVEGSAERARDGFALKLRPNGSLNRTLPAGVLFPAGHGQALLEAALAGEKFLSHQVFDGSDIEGPTQITAVIGTPRAVQAELGSGRGWPVTLSFFSFGSIEQTPSYQLEMILRENGVASDLRLDYGDFVLRGRLDVLEERPAASCR
ncbi:MAG: cell envelope integrity EipB family protein [Alphaproteobacteria bacterium]|nr:cell envelope integrity EipB family protein [Alphaproteobacteria bacterium]